MTLLNKILTWSEKSLVPWQRDALRRLFDKEVLRAVLGVRPYISHKY
jgi:hypothetical protein